MWLGLIILIVIVLALLGGVIVGGVYALVLLPIAAVILLGALLSMLWRRSRDPAARARTAERLRPPSVGGPAGGPAGGGNAPSAPSTPDEILDARRDAS
jgi:uncharacterized membrane protein YfcA